MAFPVNPLSHTLARHTPSLNLLRAFATSSALQALSSDKALARKHANIPDYRFPPSRWYKQSNYGLYAGARIRFGNTVSSKTETKNRRKWHPNVRDKRLYSEALGRFIRVRIVTKVLRTIDKAGGLDEYLLGEKSGRIRELGMGGWALRWRITRTEKVRERYRAQREAMGLDGPAPWEINSIESDRNIDERELKAREEQIDAILNENEAVELEELGDEGFMAEEEVPTKEEAAVKSSGSKMIA